MNRLALTPAEFCAATKPCAEGREFALRYPTMAEVWDACPRPDWLMWIARKVDRVPDDRTLRLFAVWCANASGSIEANDVARRSQADQFRRMVANPFRANLAREAKP